LTRLGIDTKVLKIKWPKDLIPSESSKFESLARRYRFQILGEACRDSNVRSLLLAHHEDDYYETILMRLASGHKGPGLLGMRSNARIPECYGIYGVYDSGTTSEDFLRRPLARPGISNEQWKPLSSKDLTGTQKAHKQNEPMVEDFQINEALWARWRTERRNRRLGRGTLGRMQLENGGIRVLRPLLQYSKERLIATCLQDGTSWFEDHTNADPTLTPRNAIRHIYKQHFLPAALQKDAIIALSTSMKEKKASLDRESLAVLNHCVVRGFEPRAGSLFVQFPKLVSSESDLVSEKDKKGAKQDQREIARRLLKYAIEAVSPYEHIQYPLEQACNTVFPELNAVNDQGEVYPNRFTVAGVMFSKNERIISVRVADAASGSGWYQGSQRNSNSIPMQEYKWFLSRQPYASIVEQQPMLEYPPFATFKDENAGWKLYDGRYWIRVFNHSFTTIKVRPLRQSDLATFHNVGFKTHEGFRHRMKMIAPGDVRFTLPVIVMAAERPDEKEKVLALPTLDVRVFDSTKFMDYEIRYKKVEWPLLQYMR
jgi:tRNA(Ile)-lysidine synthase